MNYIVLGEEKFEGKKKFVEVVVNEETLEKAVTAMHLQGIRIADIYKKIEWTVHEKR